MPRDRQAEREEQRRREEQERRRERQREAEREEQRRREAQELQRELDRAEEQRRQRAEASRQRTIARRREEREAAERAAARHEAAQEEARAETNAERRAEARSEEEERERIGRRRDEATRQRREQANALPPPRREREPREPRETPRREPQRQPRETTRQREPERQPREAPEREPRERPNDDRTRAQQQERLAQRRQEEREQAQRAERQEAQRAERQEAQRSERGQQRLRQAQRPAPAPRPRPPAPPAPRPSTPRPRPAQPTGRLSGTRPWLATRGNQIVNRDTGARVLLRGVNRSGLEYSLHPARGFLTPAGLTRVEIMEIVTGWRANVIRLPFVQEGVLSGGAGWPASTYLTALDTVIQWTASFHAYTILDLQWISRTANHGDAGPNRVPPLPNADSITMWRSLAARYRHEPAVLYDIFNEPHTPIGPPLQDVTPLRLTPISPLVTPTPTSIPIVDVASWHSWAREIVEAIRAVHPDSLIFIGGIDWSYDLTGIPLVDRSGTAYANIVYSTHVYPWKGPRPPAGTPPANFSTLPDSPGSRNWLNAFGRFAPTWPVFVGEWGFRPGDEPWGNALDMFMRTRGMSWTAWDWINDPHLRARDARGVMQPTSFGNIVRHRLANP